MFLSLSSPTCKVHEMTFSSKLFAGPGTAGRGRGSRPPTGQIRSHSYVLSAPTALFQAELAAQKGLEIKCQNPGKDKHEALEGNRWVELRKGHLLPSGARTLRPPGPQRQSAHEGPQRLCPFLAG